MAMPLAEYNRSRPGSALGASYAINGAGSSRTSGVVGSIKPAAVAQSRAPPDEDYESDDLDFEAYKKSRFPTVASDSKHGRSTSALGMTGSAESASNEALTTSENPTRSRNTSSAGMSASATSTGSSRLASMKRALEARSSSNPPSRTPALPNGRLTQLKGISESTPLQDVSKSSSASVSPSDPVPYSNPSSTVTIKPTRSSSQPGVSRSTSAGLANSPESDSASSDGGDISLDMGSFENGIAARRHYRELEERLNVMREVYRKDPKNASLSDSDLNKGAKAIELEDPEERLLYKELRDYVVRDGKLGPYWEKYCAVRDQSGAGILDDDGDEGDEEDLDEILKRDGLDEDDSGVITSKYHDALDEPHGEMVDLASFEEPRRERAQSNERPGHGRLQSITTSDLPSSSGPLSAGSSGAGSRQPPYTSSSPEDRNPVPMRSSSAAGHRPPNPSALQYQSELKPAYQTQVPHTEVEEEDVPIQGSKFQNVALNDTLQLRQQRTPWSALPPDAIIYEPRAPPTRSARKVNRSPDGGKTPRMGQPPPMASSQPLIANPAALSTKAKRFNSSQTVHAPPTGQSLAHQQRLTKSAGKRPVEKRDYGSAGQDERRPGGTNSRPNSSKGMRGEEERGDEEADAAGYGYNGVGRSTTSQPPSHQEQWLHQQNYYGANMRASQPPPPTANGNQYYNGANDPYGGQGRSSSPVEHDRQGQNAHSAYTDRTPGPATAAKAPLARANTLPGNANGLIGPDIQKYMIMVNNNQYLRLELVGRGGTSKVYRVIRTRDWRQFALKKVAMNTMDDDAMRNYTTEIQMLKRLSGNASVVKLIDDELKGNAKTGTLFLVMELGETDFSKMLDARQGTPISLPWITLYFKQMLEAVHVIHEERIVHSDLKPANFVLIGNSLKLIDFGIAKAIANDTTNIHRDTQIGTVNYMSPETFNAPPGEDRYKIGRPSDVWSLGCILYQMVYGQAPFSPLSLQQKLSAITRGDYVIPYPEYSIPMVSKDRSGTGKVEYLEHLKVKVPMELIVTIQNCLHRQATMRPTIIQILQEPWLEGLYDKGGDASIKGQVQALALAEDEAVISTLYMWQLIHFCFRSYDESWDENEPDNIERVERMADEIMRQLQQLRTAQ